MLVLSRNPDQRITLMLPDGREFDLVVCEIGRGGKVRLGIDAPHDVKVYRSEVLAEARQKDAAAPGAPDGVVPSG